MLLLQEKKYKEFVHNSTTDELQSPTDEPQLEDAMDALLPENLMDQVIT